MYVYRFFKFKYRYDIMISVSLFNQYIYIRSIYADLFISTYIYTHLYLYTTPTHAHFYILSNTPAHEAPTLELLGSFVRNFRRGHCNRLLDPSFWKICQTPTSRERWEGWMFGGIQFFFNFISEILQHIAFVSAICFAETSRCLGCTTLVIVSFGVIFEWIPCWTVGSNDFVWDTIRFAEDADQTCNFWGNSYSHSAVCVWQIE